MVKGLEVKLACFCTRWKLPMVPKGELDCRLYIEPTIKRRGGGFRRDSQGATAAQGKRITGRARKT
jgi:hypothetical protein